MNWFDRRSAPSVSGRTARHMAPSAVRLCLGALCLLPLVALAGQGDAPALLRLKFRQGEVNKYQVTLQATLRMTQTMPTEHPHQPPPQPMVVPISTNLLMQQQVTRVASNGNGVVTNSFLNQQTTISGSNPGGGASSPPITMTITPLGKITSITGISRGDMMNTMLSPTSMLGLEMFLLQMYLPSKPVRLGDTWTDSLHLTGLNGTGTARSKFLKYETVGHYRAARIRTELTLPIHTATNMMGQSVGRGSGAVSVVTGSVHIITERDFAVAEGKVIRSTGNGTISAVMKSPRATAPSKPGMGIMPRSTEVNLKMVISTDLMQ